LWVTQGISYKSSLTGVERGGERKKGNYIHRFVRGEGRKKLKLPFPFYSEEEGDNRGGLSKKREKPGLPKRKRGGCFFGVSLGGKREKKRGRRA